MRFSSYTNSDESLGLLFWQVSTLWQRKIKSQLQKLNLTHTQYVILAVIEELSEYSNSITQKNISDFSRIDVMTVSSTLKLLEKKELVKRLPHKYDTRAHSIINTTTGTALLQQAIKKVEKVDDEFFCKDKEILSKLRESLVYLKEHNDKS